MLSIDQFKTLFPANRQSDAWTDAINTYCPQYGIDTPGHLAHFLAQVGHESQGFTRLIENMNYSAQGLANTWPKRYAIDPKAATKQPNELALRLQRNPEAIGNNVYANRNGNGDEASGDGYRYRGHGPLQNTGKGNLLEFANEVGMPLAEALEYILTPAGGIIAACRYWQSRNVNRAAGSSNVTAVTVLVNGGINGLADRKEIYAQATGLLTAQG